MTTKGGKGPVKPNGRYADPRVENELRETTTDLLERAPVKEI